MAKGLVDEQNLTDIANAIRAKNGTSAQYKPSEMAGAIINIPETISSSIAPSSISFSGYTGNSLNLLGLDISNITKFSRMFEDCYNLNNLVIPSWNTSNITSMIAMFSECRELKSLDLSNFDTSNVTDMSQMFSNCYLLEKLDISNFTFKEGVDTDNMFINTGVNLGLENTIVYVKDEAAQQAVLNSFKVPSDWSTENVIIKEAS